MCKYQVAYILVESFAECLSSFEAAVLKKALDKDIVREVKASLIAIRSQYGCQVCPNPETLSLQLASTVYFELKIKPLAACCTTIANGIPLDKRNFGNLIWLNNYILCI